MLPRPQCQQPHAYAGSRAFERRGTARTTARHLGTLRCALLPRSRIKRVPREKEARVRIGSFEFKKKGVSRFDLRDPYHLAIALTWPQFLAALLALYLAVNVVFATLFSLVPGSVANARPGSFAQRRADERLEDLAFRRATRPTATAPP